VRKFASRLKKKYRVQKLIMFGSRARGDHLKSSDYDFVIVSQDFEGLRFGERMALVSELWEAPYGLEALCYTPEEFERKSNQITIVREAVREGIEIDLGA